jgi:hypothetical protein
MRVILTALCQVWLVLVGSSSWVVATFLEQHRKFLVRYQSFWLASTLLEVSSSPNACWICLRVIVFWAVQHSYLIHLHRTWRPSRVLLALRRSRSSIHWRFPCCCPHWHGRSRPGWVSDQQRPLHRFDVLFLLTGTIFLNTALQLHFPV